MGEGSGPGRRRIWWRRVAICLVGGLVVAVALLAPAPGGAATCGGDVPCRCGDVVAAGTAVLAADLGPCLGDGLRVRGDARLDCDGHAVVGAEGSRVGVQVDAASGAHVARCVITGFARGLRVRGGRDVVVRDVESFANREYGIELATRTQRATLERVLVHHNGDEGIHVGSGADAATIRDARVHDNRREELYVLATQGIAVHGGRFSSTGGAVLYVKHSRDGSYQGATITGGSVQVRGDSHTNTFADIVLEGGGFAFQAMFERPPGGAAAATAAPAASSAGGNSAGRWTFPHDNLVRGGSIRGVPTCFRFDGAYANEAREVTSDGCVPTATRPAGGRVPTENRVELIGSP